MKNKIKYIIPLVGIILIVLILVVLIFLSMTVSSAIMEQAVEDNKEITDQRASIVSSVIEKNGDEIDHFLSFADKGFEFFPDRFDAFNIVQTLSEKMSSKTLVYFLNDGKAYFSNGTIYENTDNIINELRSAGKDAVSTIFYDKDTNEQMIAIYSAYNTGKYINGAVGTYLVSEIYSQCRFTDNIGNEFYFIDKSGQILFSPNVETSFNNNIKSVLLKYNFTSDTINNFFNSLELKQKNSYSNDKDDNRTIIGICPVTEKGDFYAVSVTPEATIVSSVYDAFKSSIVVSVLILFFFIALIVYLRITENSYSKKLIRAENLDKIAGCNNQSQFEKEAEQLLKSRIESRYAVLYINIMNYRYINNVYGFQAFDDIISRISQVLHENLNREETYGRHVDGHLIALVTYLDKNEIEQRFNRIFNNTLNITDSNGSTISPKFSIGIYCVDRADKLSVAEMINFSVFAQQSNSEDGVNKFAFYTQESRDKFIRAVKIEEAMETALAKGEFEIYLQPKYNIQKNHIEGAEALARWTGNDLGTILPENFISQFERNGFIMDLDHFVFEEVCKFLAAQKKEGRKTVPVSVNVSRPTVRNHDFLQTYIKIKNEYNIENGLLEIEFDESIALEDCDYLKKIISSLKQNGFICTIDKFGSKNSSFKVLKQISFDCLKLDKVFLQKSDNPLRDQVMISGIISFAKHLDMKVVIEGVESEKELSMLKKLECDSVQGFIYSKPMSLIEYKIFLDQANANKIKPEKMFETSVI